MLFKSEVLTQASGSIGGVTYSRNRSGMYRRARSIPVNTNTGFQTTVRSALTALVTRWTSVLTDAQRSAWNLYGESVPVVNPLGDSITLSGQNWYIGSNSPRIQAQEKLGGAPAIAVVDAAPTIFDRGDFTTPTFEIDQGDGLSLTFTNTDDWAGEVGSVMLVFQGRPQNASINFFNGPYRLVQLIRGAVVPPSSPVATTASNLATFGFVASAGQLQWMAVAVIRADGRYSTRRVIGPVTVTSL